MANPNEILGRLAAGAPNSLASVTDQLAGASLGDGLRGLNTQIEQLRGLFQAQTASTKENTEALARVASTQSTGGGVASAVGNAAKSAASSLGGGFLLSPLLSGVLKLFGRDRSPEPPPALPTFSLPRSISVDGSIQDGGTSGIAATTYGQDGLPRVAAARPVPATQVTVQVNAMDSRSFLDRSDDIARAVKEAMLHSHSVNDVIGEL